MHYQISEFIEIINEHKNIVFFGGAGVSTESGIPDFRSAQGLFKENQLYSPETIVSHSFYKNNTEDFYDFYRNKLLYPNAKPNCTHFALTKLEKMGKLNAVITQNIDGLHQLAGTQNVIELHGSVLRNYCELCKTVYPLDYIINSINLPICRKCGGIIRPDVVLYEESLDNLIVMEAINQIEHADVLIIGGTSLVVYPAAGLIEYFHGEKLIIINKTPTPQDHIADLIIEDSLGNVFKYV